MDREQIIQMARDAGLTEHDFGDWMIDYGYAEDQITKFAELVRAATKEEDAKICDDYANEMKGDKYYHDACSSFLAQSIRASK